MKKNIWIFNHYATDTFKDRGGRHYWFAENLIKKGYNPTLFCANTIHNFDEVININDAKFRKDCVDGIPYVFVKTTPYSGNGKQRIKNMIVFYKNLFSVTKKYAKLSGKPDIILASSVHPLTLVAGIQIAKKFKVPCVCEVRDLWPESIVAYGILKHNNIIVKALYQGEKWIYKKANSIIMTWEGGKDYIKERGWDKQIDLSKVNYISNGVVIESFDKNSEVYQLEDPDLENKHYKNIIYAGSIRKVNNIGILLDAAKIIQECGVENIKFLIYGSGDECEMLKKRCTDEDICNVVFKGQVEKRYIPYILKKAYINVLHNSSTSLDKYGQSQNKFFEYLAAGKCIVQTYTTGYSICEKANCGFSVPVQNAEEIAKAILFACSDDRKNKIMGKNARSISYHYDFNRLTEKLIDVIEKL